MLKGIGQIAINVYDVERATAFYRDVLGIRFLFSAPPQLAFFEIGGVTLMLSPPDRPELDHPASILYFDVDDIAAAFADLSGKGVAFVDEPHRVHRDGSRELWLATFHDTEGNMFSLRNWKAA
jgi:predicted enzyme related to lactoylglutathione lyase